MQYRYVAMPEAGGQEPVLLWFDPGQLLAAVAMAGLAAGLVSG
jgi:hypothetical protein